MLTFTTVNYSDIYAGPKPTMEELLAGINPKIIVILMAVINSELYIDSKEIELQDRLTAFVIERFTESDKKYFIQKLLQFKARSKDSVAIWGKRYTLEFLNYLFINYQEGLSVNSSPEEELRIFKAYLLLCENSNEKDRIELSKFHEAIKTDDSFFYEKLVWPFVLNQFESNNQVNPVSQFFKLLAFLKYSIADVELLDSWKLFISQNGFKNLREYLGSVYSLINIAQRYNPDDNFLKVFSWINATELSSHLLNLSFNIEEFKADPSKQIDFLGIKERPLFKSNENEFVVLDIDYLNNKIYNGPLFDMYIQTTMAQKTRFKRFPDFKAHIGTHVSENIVFKGLINQIFKQKHLHLYFDDDNADNLPDCYIRYNKKLFLIEFKDYLFPGRLVNEYSFEKIKAHLDLKFIKNERGSNKGISQIIQQLKILSDSKFDFDKYAKDKLTIYPVIIHTNFMYQMPGINHYLNEQFEINLKKEIPNIKYTIEPLALIDIETFFDFLRIKDFTFSSFQSLLNRYFKILENRERHFLKEINQSNYVKARSSFDEIHKTVFRKGYKYHAADKMIDILLNAMTADEQLLDAF